MDCSLQTVLLAWIDDSLRLLLPLFLNLFACSFLTDNPASASDFAIGIALASVAGLHC